MKTIEIIKITPQGGVLFYANEKTGNPEEFNRHTKPVVVKKGFEDTFKEEGTYIARGVIEDHNKKEFCFFPKEVIFLGSEEFKNTVSMLSIPLFNYFNKLNKVEYRSNLRKGKKEKEREEMFKVFLKGFDFFLYLIQNFQCDPEERQNCLDTVKRTLEIQNFNENQLSVLEKQVDEIYWDVYC